MYTKEHAEALKKHAGEKWRPANGEEGSRFHDHFCADCKKDNPEKEDYCPLILLTMNYDVEDEEYPVQWQIHTNGLPVCTDYDAKEG